MNPKNGQKMVIFEKFCAALFWSIWMIQEWIFLLFCQILEKKIVE